VAAGDGAIDDEIAHRAGHELADRVLQPRRQLFAQHAHDTALANRAG